MRVAGHPVAEPFGSRQDDVSELADPAEPGRKRREEEFVCDNPRLARAVARTAIPELDPPGVRAAVDVDAEQRAGPVRKEPVRPVRRRTLRFTDAGRLAGMRFGRGRDNPLTADSPRFSVLPPSSGPSCATRPISSSTMVSGEHSRRALGQCRRIRGAVSLPLNRRHLELYGSRRAVPSDPGPGQGMRSKSLWLLNAAAPVAAHGGTLRWRGP